MMINNRITKSQHIELHWLKLTHYISINHANINLNDSINLNHNPSKQSLGNQSFKFKTDINIVTNLTK